MKARPILFSGEMVRAILEGRKTQTRRIINPPKDLKVPLDEYFYKCSGNERPDWCFSCPYGQSGDLLWVRETINRGYCGAAHMSRYAADGFPTKADWWPWQRNVLASIHCPQGLSRITLRITSVRVERLQDISRGDAIAEGLIVEDHMWRDPEYPLPDVAYRPTPKSDYRYSDPVQAYQDLWEQINGAGAWDKNPWIWVVEFEVIQKNILEVPHEQAG